MVALFLKSIRTRLTQRRVKHSIEPVFGSPLLAWRSQLPVVAHRALDVLDLLAKPKTQNALMLRYIVIDLLDVLAGLRIIPNSPLCAYGDLYGSFDDHFCHSWHNLACEVFTHDSASQRQSYAWAKAIHTTRQFNPTHENLHVGIKIWDTQPSLIVGPSPVAWDMAVPRLLAYFYSDSLWNATLHPLYLDEAYQLMAEFSTVPLTPAQTATVLWKRIRHTGLGHLSYVLTAPTHICPDTLAGARYAWMQNCLYYALIRGKLDHMSAAEPAATQALLQLDAALAVHIKLLSTKGIL